MKLRLIILLLLASAALGGGEPDWFTRVKEQGLAAASQEEVARHENGVLDDSLHIGECYFRVGRHADGVKVFARLIRSPDRNYAAMARCRLGEGYFHLEEPGKAKEAFNRCLEEHPEAWLDGSVPDLCRAWLMKLGGKIVSPQAEEEKREQAVEALKREAKELEERLAELRRLLDELRK